MSACFLGGMAKEKISLVTRISIKQRKKLGFVRIKVQGAILTAFFGFAVGAQL
jgi:hypothetical protein